MWLVTWRILVMTSWKLKNKVKPFVACMQILNFVRLKNSSVDCKCQTSLISDHPTHFIVLANSQKSNLFTCYSSASMVWSWLLLVFKKYLVFFPASPEETSFFHKEMFTVKHDEWMVDSQSQFATKDLHWLVDSLWPCPFFVHRGWMKRKQSIGRLFFEDNLP